jgi:hypothetical protein
MVVLAFRANTVRRQRPMTAKEKDLPPLMTFERYRRWHGQEAPSTIPGAEQIELS